ncbi:NAD(P)-dependent oxidoreductase [Vreelandella populi]|uniref:NAD(P)-dependent oxidoreductase n=1 Tax=Vreelandella populi TaxID=2498858 RepID=A0A433LDF5_9GAMM|nr:NAD(P)-dependent oxidoreductase [Halomonas populi]RUR35263.1 NAD(P)-dependent oxidoreductase [Halomonas populi]RUR47454.1 NAD(P)-dependent oxidoreductase [Halomonas populi]
MTTSRSIGFIGTGIMGAPMARRLAKAGHQVRAWNRTKSKADSLETVGVETVERPEQAVTESDVVIVMLSSGPVCDELLLGSAGLLNAMQPGATLIVMSSIPVETARRQAEEAATYQIHYLDAPVSGGEQGAIDGTLAIMVGGDSESFKAVEPILLALGRPVHVGPAGSGELVKLANQMIVANTIATVAEAILLAEQGGANPAQMLNALEGGFADSTILRIHGQRMIKEDFTPGGPSKWQLKDTQTAMALAQELQLKLPVSSLVNGLYEALIAQGEGDLDHSALIRQLRRHNQ